MCIGHAVRMTRCHHILYHYRARCEERCWELCDQCQEAERQSEAQEFEEKDEKKEKAAQISKCKKWQSGETCEKAKPSGPEYYLDDYCSACDPSWKLYQAKFFYVTKVEEWEQQRLNGTPDDELDEILARLERNYLDVVQKIREDHPEPPEDVAFLPCVDMTQLGLNSQYVDKYICVWDDPPDKSRRIRKVEGCYLQANGYWDESGEEDAGRNTSFATGDDKCRPRTSDESDGIPPDDSRSLYASSEVDWLEIADMQLQSNGQDQSQTIIPEKPRVPRPMPMPEMDRLPSLLPPEMTRYSNDVAAKSFRSLQPLASNGRLPQTRTAGDAVLRWGEIKRSQQSFMDSLPHR